MTRDIDLCPWILGGCLLIAGAAALAVDADSQPASASKANAPLAASAATSSAPPHAGDLSPVLVSSNARPQLPPGQVWECEVDGQRVFSDVHCGAHATVRQLRELNTMEANTVPRVDRYPGNSAGAYPPGPPPMSDAAADDQGADYSGDVYAGQQVIVARDRSRRDHHRHPSPRPHPRARN